MSSAQSISTLLPVDAVQHPGGACQNFDRETEARWFNEEVRPHESALRAYVRGRFPQLMEIDDLIQEVYARVFRARKVRDLKDVRPYLFTVARNAGVDFHRRKQVVRFESIGENELRFVVEDEPNAAEIVSRNQELDLLQAAIRALPDRCREVLVLRRFHGLSHRQIADRLGIAQKTVDAQLCIGVFRCREYLQAHGMSGKSADGRNAAR